jgi:hypothetical protein
MKELNAFDTTISQRKKIYKKPELMRVALKPEEALSAGCKTASISGPGNPTCLAVQCFDAGS